MALLMVPGSRITPADIVDTLSHCDHLLPWMAGVFVVGKPANDLAVAEKWVAARGDHLPGWFGFWFHCARQAYVSDEWRIASAEIVVISPSISVLRPDVREAWPGNMVKLKEPQPGGTVKEVTEFEPLSTVNTEGSQTLGITAMSEKAARELNAAQAKRGKRADARLMFSDKDNVISGLPGDKGTILLGTRVMQDGEEINGLGRSLIPYTLFHELLHAGSISAERAFKEDDPRFKKIATQIRLWFTGPAVPAKAKPTSPRNNNK